MRNPFGRQAASTPPAAAPWVRTRLRSSRAAALALVLLVLACTFLAAALPRQFDRYQDAALRHALATADLGTTALEATSDAGGDFPPPRSPAQVSDAALAATGPQIAAVVRPPLAVERTGLSYGLHTTGTKDVLTDRTLPRPSNLAPVLTLDWQPDIAAHARLLSGRLPVYRPERGPGGPAELETALSTATAKQLGVHVGSTLHFSPADGAPTLLKVVGVFAPTALAQPYWADEPRLARPTLSEQSSGGNISYYWNTEALVASDAKAVLTDFGGVEAYWWLPLSPDSTHAYQIGSAQSELAGLKAGPQATRLLHSGTLPGGVVVNTSLPSLLSDFTEQSAAVLPLITIGAAGAAGVAVTVLLMVGGLAADRRDGELALLRARGGSLPALARRIFGETLLCTTAGAVPGLAAAVLLFPGARLRYPLLAAGAVWLLATLAVALRALARCRRPAGATGRADLTAARPSRRRTVTEAAVLVAAATAVVLVRKQGVVSGAGVDPLLSCAPLLLGLAGALLLLRIYPWPLRIAARRRARGRGAIGFLGLARAGRASAAVSVLPLLALLLALSVGAFGAEVLTGISDGRARAATEQVGADASVSAVLDSLPPALVDAVGRSAGVRSVVAIQQDIEEQFGSTGISYDLDVVDPAPYTALAHRTGGDSFQPSLLDYQGHGPIPVLASPDLASYLGSHPQTLDNLFGTFQVRVVGTVDHALITDDSGFLLVSRSALAALPQPPGGSAPAPTALLLSGPVNGNALRAAVARTEGPVSAEVQVRTEILAALERQSPQQTGGTTLYGWTVAAAVLLSVLAILLSLLQAAPGRANLLARLRTMGLTPRQGYLLILLEALPQLVLGVVAGAALGLAAIPLFGPSLDLSALVGSSSGLSPVGALGPSGLKAAPLPTLLPAVGLLLLGAAVVAVEAAVVGKRQIGIVLRAGDQR